MTDQIVNLIDISMVRPGCDVVVNIHIAGITISMPNGDVLDLFHNDGKLTLLLYPNGMNEDSEPTPLYHGKAQKHE